MCFRRTGVVVGRVPGQGRNMSGIPELRGCGVFGNWRKESRWSREGQGGWKVRKRHQTSEDKSRILQGLEGDIRGCRFHPIAKKDEPCEHLHTGVKWSHLCFRIIWKQTGRVNCSCRQRRQEDP